MSDSTPLSSNRFREKKPEAKNQISQFLSAPLTNDASSQYSPSIESSGRNSGRTQGGGSISSQRRQSRIKSNEFGLQSLLMAETRAAEMIRQARTRRVELLRRAYRESQAEINAFREKLEVQYQEKLRRATQIDQYRNEIEINQKICFEQMEKSIQIERQSLVDYLVQQIIDEIVVQPDQNVIRIDR